MDSSQMRIRPGFILGLLVIFVLLPWLAGMLLPAGSYRTKAMLIKTRSDERAMAFLLEERAGKMGAVANINNQFILDSLFATNQYQAWFTTNAAGEVLDIWHTPFQIELVGRTNFAVRSAGKDKIFGDADDIIFNSASNNFVKP